MRDHPNAVLRTALLFSFALCGSAQAGDASGATIQRIEITPGTMLGVIHMSGVTGAAACASTGVSGTGRFALDLRTPQGQEAFGLALAAHARRAPVNLSGSGACDLMKSAETAATLSLAQPWSMQPPYVPVPVKKHCGGLGQGVNRGDTHC